MRFRRRVADVLIKALGLRKLHDTAAQRVIRSVLDEIDLQYLRDSHPCRSFSCREEMYAHVHESIVKGEAMDYLEFGVYRGDSLRCWTRLNKHEASRFYGFDSFQGLPEPWRKGQGKGHFDVGGGAPQIDDPRVNFVKGWFADTIPSFARDFAVRNPLVMHLDADLYGSTMLPLLHFGPFISRGTLMIFDEFYDREHEFKALMDWQRIYRRESRIVAEVGNYSKVTAQLL